MPDRPLSDDERTAILARAEAFGVDLSLVRESLRLTPGERLERHRRARSLALALNASRPNSRP